MHACETSIHMMLKFWLLSWIWAMKLGRWNKSSWIHNQSNICSKVVQQLMFSQIAQCDQPATERPTHCPYSTSKLSRQLNLIVMKNWRMTMSQLEWILTCKIPYWELWSWFKVQTQFKGFSKGIVIIYFISHQQWRKLKLSFITTFMKKKWLLKIEIFIQCVPKRWTWEWNATTPVNKV